MFGSDRLGVNSSDPAARASWCVEQLHHVETRRRYTDVLHGTFTNYNNNKEIYYYDYY